MNFVSFESVANRLKGKRVAVVGSAPSCTDNEPGYVDSHDVVVRVNNHKCGEGQGFRTDIHYSFYGTSIRKSVDELKREGVSLCMSKLPDAKPLESEWHVRNGKLTGIDYRYIYKNRASWWFCDTFIPDVERFMTKFELLGKHQPSTGFAAILDILDCEPESIYLTGFDFFESRIHNVNEPWREKNQGKDPDPICHRPDIESRWLRENVDRYPILLDGVLSQMIGKS